MAGSLAPDVDAVFMPLGWDIYLRRHQGGTHSLVGSIACAALAAAAVRLVSKRARFGPLLVAAWAGAAGHLLLDVISGADVRFFWPLGPPVRDAVAMADPWWGVLVLGLVCSCRTRNRRAGGRNLLAWRCSPEGGILYAGRVRSLEVWSCSAV